MSGDPKIKAAHAVRAAHARIAEVVEAERDAVIAARQLGVQWRKIADAVGMAQPNASRKYGPIPAAPGKPDRRKPSDREAGAAVRQVAAAHQAILNAELAEIEAVAAARAAGVTWAAIAAEVGMEQPNAVVKYRQYISEVREVAVRADAADRLRGRRARTPRGEEAPSGS